MEVGYTEIRWNEALDDGGGKVKYAAMTCIIAVEVLDLAVRDGNLAKFLNIL